MPDKIADVEALEQDVDGQIIAYKTYSTTAAHLLTPSLSETV